MVIYTRWWWSERIEEWTFNKSRTNIRTSDVSLSRVAGTRVLTWHTQRRAQWSLSLLIQIRKILQVSWTSGWEREEGGGKSGYINTFTFMHLADAFIQSDLLSIFRLYFLFLYQYVCSLGIEPTTFCAANAMLYHWATGTTNSCIVLHILNISLTWNIFIFFKMTIFPLFFVCALMLGWYYI